MSARRKLGFVQYALPGPGPLRAAPRRLGIERDLHLQGFLGKEERERQNLAGLLVDQEPLELVRTGERVAAELFERLAHLELGSISRRSGRDLLDRDPLAILRRPDLYPEGIATPPWSRERTAPWCERQRQIDALIATQETDLEQFPGGFALEDRAALLHHP